MNMLFTPKPTLFKITLDVVSDFHSNTFVAVAETLANAGLETHDVVSIARVGIDCNGNDEFEVVFHNRRAAELAAAWHHDEGDIDIEFVRDMVEPA